MRLAALGFLLVLPAFGQAQKAEYSVHGIVRNGVTGEPVRNALVVLMKLPDGNLADSAPGGDGEQQNNAILSGPGGEFRFDGLRAGVYTYIAHKPGFTRDENYGNFKTFVIPQASADGVVQLKLTPLGTIEGKVVNQYDEPLENVVLNVYALSIQNGEKIATNVGTVWTDDRGSFHLAWLEPDSYFVKAVSMRGGTETHFGAYAMRYAPWEGFSPVYFGGATDIMSATPIPVAAGTRVRAGFRLEMQPIFKIRGQVQGYAAPETVTFEILREDDLTEPSRVLLDVTTGKFEVLDVLPGTYRLRATQGKTRGEVTVTAAEPTSAVSPSLCIRPRL